MSICINTSHPEFVALQDSTGINPILLRAKVAIWQQRNNSDEFPDAGSLEYKEEEVNHLMNVTRALQEFIQPDDTKRTRKYGEAPGSERLTLRLNTKARPDLEANLRKRLQGKGVSNDQIDIVFDHMKANNIKEISVEDMIAKLLAENSFTVEINTATKEDTGFSTEDNQFEPDYDEEGNMIPPSTIDRPTSYYSNLTVPGGTNYTENEISTPAIIPAIKGHGDFSTDQGIGWFRSDDADGKSVNKDIVKSITEVPNTFMFSGEEVYKEFGEWYYGKQSISDQDALFKYNQSQGLINNKAPKETKTRRILEVQSDLFQKSRDKEVLVGKPVKIVLEVGKKYFDTDVQKEYEIVKYSEGDDPYFAPDENQWEPGYPDTLEIVYADGTKGTIYEDGISNLLDRSKEIDEDIEKSLAENDNALIKNQFLQLLNKKGNWVNFFIQSIVKDSAKKGYEKVLFPTGETAAKVEGHESLADELKKLQKEKVKAEEWEASLKEREKTALENMPSFFETTDGITAVSYDEELDIYEADNIINLSELPQRISKKEAQEFYKNSEDFRNETGDMSNIRPPKEIQKQIDSLKAQGLEKLKPVEAFYSNRVTNILNKLYDVKRVTDENGNTWNEVTIDAVKERQTPVFFQQPSSLQQVQKLSRMFNINDKGFFGSQINPDDLRPRLRKLGFGLKKTRTGTGYYITRNNRKFNPFGGASSFRSIENSEVPADPVIDGRMKDIMNDLGIELASFDEYKEWYETKYGEKLQANAVADMMQKVIAVKEGSQRIDTLPEEVAHFVVFALRNDSRVQELMDSVEGSPIWEAESAAYMSAYNNDKEKVKMELVGKMIADGLIRGVKETTTPKQRTLIQRIWNAFKNLFTFGTRIKERRVKSAIDSIVSQTLNDTKSIKEELKKQVAKDDVFFQIDVKNFQNSKVLDGMRPKLKEAIDIVSDKIKRYQTKKKYTAKETVLRAKLFKSLDDNRTTEGLVTFINKVESEADALLDRIVAIRQGFQEGVYDDNLNEFGSTLRDLSVYIEAYRPLIDSIISETSQQKRILEKEDPASYGEDGISLNNKIQQLDEIIKALDNINKGMTAMSDSYEQYATNLFVSSFRPFLERRYAGEPDADVKVTEEIQKLLKSAESTDRDIPLLRRWLDSMAESTDDFLMLTDRLVKEHIEKAAFDVDDIMKDILDADAELKQSGVKNTEWLYERLDGNVTGNYISKINQKKFDIAKDEFFDSLHKRYGLSPGRENVEIRKIELSKLNAQAYVDYQRDIAQWFEENTEVNPEFEKILNAKREDIYKQLVNEKFNKRIIASQRQEAERVFQEWKNERYVTYTEDGYVQKVSFRRELASPKKSIYGNPEFEKLSKAQKKYYKGYMELRDELTKHMPEEFRNNPLAIQIRKDFIERAKSDPKRTLSESIIDGLTEREDDTAFGRSITDESGNPIKNVPIYYFKQLDDMADLSLDATANMIMFADMATRHRELSKVVDIVEIGRDVIGNRKILSSTGVKKGGNAYDRYVDYMNMVVYGETKLREGEFFGISKAKAADALAKYTALNGLALNVYAGFSNVIFGEVMVREEQFAKQYVNSDDMKFAEKEYWLAGKDGVSGLIGDVGKTRSSNKLRLFFEKFDVLQDFESRTKDVNTDRSRWGRMFNSSAMFFVNHIGEHQMQGRMALALANNKKLKDANGKEIPMYEAFEVKNNRLVIKDGIKNIDGSEFTQQDMIAFKLRMKGVNQKLHGIYNTTDKSAIQKYGVGRLVILFRKWLKPAFNRRFDRQYYNYSLDQEVEGMWVTTGSFMKQLYSEYKQGQFTFSRVKEAYDELSDDKKANIRRTMMEQGIFLATAFIGSALVGLADDDDDNWLLNMSAYQAQRLATELGMFSITAPRETLKIISSPSAAVNQLDNLIDLYKTVSLNPFDDEPILRRYKSGRNKDNLRLYVWGKKTIPLVDTVEDIFYPEERLKFFTN